MLTEKELRKVRRAEARFARNPPDADDLELLARVYRRAHERWSRVYDQMESVRGLDEFDPRHTAWETRLFNSENAKDCAKEILLAAARTLA